ncbi:hypothetical protein NZA98_33290, partial [Escherichia coli]|nr:hypothetical protein [Escherichia coli]
MRQRHAVHIDLVAGGSRSKCSGRREADLAGRSFEQGDPGLGENHDVIVAAHHRRDADLAGNLLEQAIALIE